MNNSIRLNFSLGFLLLLTLCGLGSCTAGNPNDQSDKKELSTKPIMEPQKIDLQGHRGCRGLFPENSLPAMRKALEIGVTSLEMDVVITKDKQVILSHEPFMSHEICLDPDGNPISEEEEMSHNIYQMDYAIVQEYDCGTKIHPRFPEQQKMRVSKPLLADVIDLAESWARENNRPAPYYNIEVKYKADQDDLFHPGAKEFSSLLVGVLRDKGVEDRAFIQSFDIGIMEECHRSAPDFTLVYLVEDTDDFKLALSRLSFEPAYYSPDYKLITPELMAYAKERGMKVVPWTVNEEGDMRKMIDMGVDGLISDYPDRLMKVVGR